MSTVRMRVVASHSYQDILEAERRRRDEALSRYEGKRLETPFDEDPGFWLIVVGLFAAIGLGAVIYGAVVLIGGLS